MSLAPFPPSPQQGDTFASGDNLWRYNNGVWTIIPYGKADYGSVNGGRAQELYILKIDNAIASSTFAADESINGGTP